MTTPQPVNAGELQVDPVAVIGILKTRLAEGISREAVLEAALLEARSRETALAEQVAALRAQPEAAAPGAQKEQVIDGKVVVHTSKAPPAHR